MRPERLEKILWERADGTIAPDELVKLEEFLAEHPDSKDLEREIARLAELLAPRDEMAPPAALRVRIDRALAAAKPPVHEVRIPRTVRARRWRDRWPARLLPVAASLVLGVAVGYLMQPGATGPIDESQAAGAMRATTAATVGAPMIVDLGADTGRVVANRVGSDLIIDIDLVRELDLRLELDAADGEIRLTGIVDSAKSPSEVTLENGRLTVRARGPGTQRIKAVVTGEASRVWFQATANGRVAVERWIE
jgi:hypothetical protein